MDACMAFYHRAFDGMDDMFETFLKSFRSVSDALLQVYSSDNSYYQGYVPKELQKEWSDKYNVIWKSDIPDTFTTNNGRCYTKMKCVADMLDAIEGNRLLVSDIDVYFLEDPFTAFDKKDFDIGVTLRVHSYKEPVNAGVFFVKVDDYTENTFSGKFDTYADRHKNLWDWGIDQAYLNYLFREGKAADVGWEYNFCPNTDIYGVKLAADMIRRAYESKSVKVLHLKSELKLLIYEGFFENAVTGKIEGKWNWHKYGKVGTSACETAKI